MTKEDAAVVDSALAQLFPANMSGEFYVSFLQDTDDNILQSGVWSTKSVASICANCYCKQLSQH